MPGKTRRTRGTATRAKSSRRAPDAAAKARRQQPPEFDFDELQLSEIWGAIVDGIGEANRPRPGRDRETIPEDLRDPESLSRGPRLLRQAAERYLQECAVPPLEVGAQRELWNDIARAAGELKNKLETALRHRNGAYWHARLREPIHPLKLEDETISIGSALCTLIRLQHAAQEWARPLWWSPSIFYTFSGRREPSVVYLQRVLMLWTMFGCELGLSRDPSSGKIGGPLARYLRAVTVPVMGQDAPAAETYRHYVRRQKALYRQWAEIKAGLDGLPSQNNAEGRMQIPKDALTKREISSRLAKRLLGREVR
jgi:hypothetical protein